MYDLSHSLSSFVEVNHSKCAPSRVVSYAPGSTCACRKCHVCVSVTLLCVCGQYSESGLYGRVRGEQAAARRVCAQLRALLQELEALRGRVRAADLPAFDRSTRPHTDLTLGAITDYLGECTTTTLLLIFKIFNSANVCIQAQPFTE